MARGRKRKSDKGQFLEEDMRNAVKLVIEQGISIRTAANQYNLKFQTLARYTKKQKLNVGTEVSMKPNYDCRLIFTKTQEDTLKEYIVETSKMCYGQTTLDIRSLAYQMAKINSIKYPNSWDRDERSGSEWLYGFLKRNPDLSIRQAEGCSLSRMTSFNYHNVSQFYTNLESALKRHPEKYADGSRIFNLDETATTTVQRPKKVVTLKGTKQVNKATSGERGTLVTTSCIISASGNTIPPVMVFPRKKFQPRMLKNAIPGTLGLLSPSGWMTATLFTEVMEHYIKYTNSSNDNPSLLILDNHESHLSLAAINLAKTNGVTLLTLPPHSSHKLQPLDVSVFSSFKSHYNSAADSWLLRNPGLPISIYEVAEFVAAAHDKSMTPKNIKSGFRRTGIYPFDKNIFLEEDFMSSYVTDRPIPDNASSDTAEIPTTSTPVATTSRKIDSTTPDNIVADNTINKEKLAITNSPSVSRKSEDNFISPKVFKGYPKAAERKSNRKGKQKGKSIIATDTPEKEELERREKEKQIKQKEKQRVRKQVFADNSSEESEAHEDHISLDDSLSDYDLNDDLQPVTGFEELERDPVKDDFVLVKFSTIKKNVFYVGKILGDMNADKDVEVSFLRRSVKYITKFVYPVVPEISIVNLYDIIRVLPLSSIQGTKRQQGLVSFEVDLSTINVR